MCHDPYKTSVDASRPSELQDERRITQSNVPFVRLVVYCKVVQVDLMVMLTTYFDGEKRNNNIGKFAMF